mmetsp:Transcript_11319/g.12821  ORF Transcript_11319/g.12821 Transcript_11319/m.12821 type:complete len:200 (-) Transcript_11319:631-1230(-)
MYLDPPSEYQKYDDDFVVEDALKVIEDDSINVFSCKAPLDYGSTACSYAPWSQGYSLQRDFIMTKQCHSNTIETTKQSRNKTHKSEERSRYTKEEEKALASASLHLDLVQIFVKNYLNVSRKTALKSAYTYYLQRPTHRSASALFRHSKELNRKKNRVKLIGVNKRKPFEKLCADLIQYLESTKIPVEQEELTESTRWR